MDPDMPKSLRTFIRALLDESEISCIERQLSRQLIANKQVLWTGMVRESAQEWADSHNLQTLTTAMGPLMDTSNRLCPKKQKTSNAWTKYIHGASALFAWRISKNDVVTVLAHPPPERFHPSGRTNFQLVEWPIITGKLGNRPVQKIKAVHPAVSQAFNFQYQLWPSDEGSLWLVTFGEPEKQEPWRDVTSKKPAKRLVSEFDAPCIDKESSNIHAVAKKASEIKGSSRKETVVKKTSKARGSKTQKQSEVSKPAPKQPPKEKQPLEELHQKKKKECKVEYHQQMIHLRRTQAKERQDLQRAINARRESMKTSHESKKKIKKFNKKEDQRMRSLRQEQNETRVRLQTSLELRQAGVPIECLVEKKKTGVSVDNSKGSKGGEKGPTQAKKGPAEAKKGLIETKKGPTKAQKGPTEAKKGPTKAKKGPGQAEKEPTEAQKGPTQAEKGATEDNIKVVSIKDPVQAVEDQNCICNDATVDDGPELDRETAVQAPESSSYVTSVLETLTHWWRLVRCGSY